MLRESDLVRALRRKKPQALPAVVEAASTKAPFPRRLSKPQQKRGPLPHTGLKNLGNTCFMNATLQCLFGCAEFCSGFIERQYPLSSNSPAQGKIAMSFAELLTDIAQDKAIVSPSNLRKALTKISPQFRGNGQHDSQELLRCLLDGLAEDLKRPPPPSPISLPREENTEIVEEAHCEAWRAYINANASPVSDHFAGLLRSTVECCKCGFKSIRYDPYLDLSLPLPEQTKSNIRSPLSAKLQKGSTSCTLEKCLEQFTATEDLTEKITCEKCKKPQKSKKSLTLQTWPRILVLHVKRFSYTETRREKLDTLVTFPTEGLDLSPFASEDRRSAPAVYDLFATTDHLGASGAAGHYVAHRKDPSGWRTFDDATHAPTTAERLQGGAAYVLWYRRRDPPKT